MVISGDQHNLGSDADQGDVTTRKYDFVTDAESSQDQNSGAGQGQPGSVVVVFSTESSSDIGNDGDSNDGTASDNNFVAGGADGSESSSSSSNNNNADSNQIAIGDDRVPRKDGFQAGSDDDNSNNNKNGQKTFNDLQSSSNEKDKSEEGTGNANEQQQQQQQQQQQGEDDDDGSNRFLIYPPGLYKVTSDGTNVAQTETDYVDSDNNDDDDGLDNIGRQTVDFGESELDLHSGDDGANEQVLLFGLQTTQRIDTTIRDEQQQQQQQQQHDVTTEYSTIGLPIFQEEEAGQEHENAVEEHSDNEEKVEIGEQDNIVAATDASNREGPTTVSVPDDEFEGRSFEQETSTVTSLLSADIVHEDEGGATTSHIEIAASTTSETTVTTTNVDATTTLVERIETTTTVPSSGEAQEVATTKTSTSAAEATHLSAEVTATTTAAAETVNMAVEEPTTAASVAQTSVEEATPTAAAAETVQISVEEATTTAAAAGETVHLSVEEAVTTTAAEATQTSEEETTATATVTGQVPLEDTARTTTVKTTRVSEEGTITSTETTHVHVEESTISGATETNETSVNNVESSFTGPDLIAILESGLVAFTSTTDHGNVDETTTAAGLITIETRPETGTETTTTLRSKAGNQPEESTVTPTGTILETSTDPSLSADQDVSTSSPNTIQPGIEDNLVVEEDGESDSENSFTGPDLVAILESGLSAFTTTPGDVKETTVYQDGSDKTTTTAPATHAVVTDSSDGTTIFSSTSAPASSSSASPQSTSASISSSSSTTTAESENANLLPIIFPPTTTVSSVEDANEPDASATTSSPSEDSTDANVSASKLPRLIFENHDDDDNSDNANNPNKVSKSPENWIFDGEQWTKIILNNVDTTESSSPESESSTISNTINIDQTSTNIDDENFTIVATDDNGDIVDSVVGVVIDFFADGQNQTLTHSDSENEVENTTENQDDSITVTSDETSTTASDHESDSTVVGTSNLPAQEDTTTFGPTQEDSYSTTEASITISSTSSVTSDQDDRSTLGEIISEISTLSNEGSLDAGATTTDDSTSTSTIIDDTATDSIPSTTASSPQEPSGTSNVRPNLTIDLEAILQGILDDEKKLINSQSTTTEEPSPPTTATDATTSGNLGFTTFFTINERATTEGDGDNNGEEDASDDGNLARTLPDSTLPIPLFSLLGGEFTTPVAEDTTTFLPDASTSTSEDELSTVTEDTEEESTLSTDSTLGINDIPVLNFRATEAPETTTEDYDYYTTEWPSTIFTEEEEGSDGQTITDQIDLETTTEDISLVLSINDIFDQLRDDLMKELPEVGTKEDSSTKDQGLLGLEFLEELEVIEDEVNQEDNNKEEDDNSISDADATTDGEPSTILQEVQHPDDDLNRVTKQSDDDQACKSCHLASQFEGGEPVDPNATSVILPGVGGYWDHAVIIDGEAVPETDGSSTGSAGGDSSQGSDSANGSSKESSGSTESTSSSGSDGATSGTGSSTTGSDGSENDSESSSSNVGGANGSTSSSEGSDGSTNTESPESSSSQIGFTVLPTIPDIATEIATAINNDTTTDVEVTETTTASTTSTTSAPLILAQAYTVFGEPCKDACVKRDYKYSWCNKIQESDVGTWSDSDYCTTESNVTPYGEACIDECEQRGYDYYWCHKTSSLWGYCTPEHLITLTKTWHFLTGGGEGRGQDLNSILTEGPEDGTQRVGGNGEESEEEEKELVVRAYTVYGEACYDTCDLRDGQEYTWCHKVKETRQGTFPNRDHCTQSAGIYSITYCKV